MKKVIFFALVIVLIIGSCTQEKKSSTEGTWQLVYAKSVIMGDDTYPAQIKGGAFKTWTKEYYTSTSYYDYNSSIYKDVYMGTYTHDGDRYVEFAMYPPSKSKSGVKFLIVILHDTLIQKWPVDDNWKLAEKYNTEKYVRVK